ncbi:DNA-processing protein DprA [Acinetobacter pseudolwoffii]|uniref:DNA protecting protein DprA n=1 Tax=Acinetobacter pseudolwoffii TaxID=2053287 RepID=N9M3K5_9GAMM|nr:DNA-processing protein DprA [Acinetobacter pseudolwoffii]ENW85296.1 DNA protecting protein DprA [Acinetobacter pseudolwoffii]PJI29583.1 DNA-protecting protein DprA [Acinetobacter pseudolwoffii]
MLNRLSTSQINAITLWYLVQHSLTSFYKISRHYADLADAVHCSQIETWQKLGLHKNHIQRLKDFQSSESQTHFQHSLEQIQLHSDFVLLHTDAEYPQQLSHYEHKPPILFGQGHADQLLQPQIAIVGSRKPSPHGQQVAYDFAFYLSEQGFYINSGLAQGIDEAAHRAALQHRRTIAVMGTGIEQTYPAVHQALRQQMINHGGTVITEFLPFTPPLQQHFPRRNRIVSGLSLGVIVAEAALKSGSLLTAQWAAEQGKNIFAIPGHIYSEHYQGCHQLIREGAILIDHPQQVIEDLALATQWQANANHFKKDTYPEQERAIPPHLIHLYNQLDWVGQSLDQLSFHLQQEVSSLTSQLMELELLGLSTQQAGMYQRCRPLK